MTQRNFPHLLACFVLGLLLADATSAAGKRRLEADDIYRALSVEDPACSRDGQWIAYTVTGADRETDTLKSSIWMVNWDGTRHVRVAPPAEPTANLRFSPDGRFVSFLSARGPQANVQLYLVDRRAGSPRALTSVGGEVGDYDWSPDGKRIVISASRANETPGNAAHDGASLTQEPKPIVIDRLHFKEDVKGYLTAEDRAQLYLLEVATKKLEPLTSDARFDDTTPVWSPDGTQIAFISNHEDDPDRTGAQELYVIEARPGATARKLARYYGALKPSVLWSADGSQIAYTIGEEPKFEAYIQDRLAVVPAAGGAAQVLTQELDRPVSTPVRLAGGTALGVLVEDDRAQLPARLELADGKVAPMLAGKLSVTDQCAEGGHIAVLASTQSSAPEIYALEDAGLRKLTAHNDALVAELELGTVEDISFPSADGTQVHGLMVKPPGFVRGQRYPTLVWVHGGPDEQDQYGLAFDTYPLELEQQWFAAHGYVVLAINYRGSSGRGVEFARAIAGDWGNKDVMDLLAGVDYAIREGIADPERLGIGGWSYGALLTDYAIATDTRFKAAISGAGSGNQLSVYGSDEYELQYNAEMGPPWRSQDRWLRVSYPFFHADRIHTPTLFVGGERDFDVPIIGGEQMYQALRTLGVPTLLVVYPEQHHFFTRPSFIKDRLLRYLDWFDRYLKPTRQ